MFNGKRLEMIRSVRGLSRAEVARACGLATRIIVGFEIGDEMPVDQERDRLASALKVSPSFFDGADAPRYGRGQASFRARASVSERTIDMALSMMSIAHLISDWFDSTVIDVPVAVPDLAGETPEDAAEMLRAEWGLGNKGISNVIHVMETKGVKVFPVDHMAPNMDAFCGWLGPRPAVFLRRGTTGARCRFDACHELGHLILHRGRDWSRDADEMEAQADAFAAAFLMPRPAILALVKPTASVLDLVALKAHWRVSVMSLNRRLRDVGVFSDRRYVENVKEFSRRGWRTSEPDDVPFEGSLIWNKALEHVGRSGSSIERVAAQVGLDPVDVEKMLTSFVMTRASMFSVPQGKGQGSRGWAANARVITNPVSHNELKPVGSV
jgi:Zn-dependent peptidase ImmA (M78 family)/transcriptional regulator with XRE-family HTH domain